jgi:TRAP-type transport system small permease protein
VSIDQAAEAESTESPASNRMSWDEIVVALLLGAIVILNFVGVVARYWLKYSIPWNEEVLTGIFGWAVFLAAGLTVVRNMHVGMSFLSGWLPKPAGWALAQLRLVAFWAFFALLSWYGVAEVMTEARAHETMVTLDLPSWYLSAAIPAGSIIAVIRITVALAHETRAKVAEWKS